MESAILSTPRLELVPTGPHLFDGLWAAIEASLSELAPWMDWAAAPDPDRTRGFTVRAAEAWASGDDRAFTLVHDGAVCGHCALMRVDVLARQCEIGYWLRSDLCGKGLMTEAAIAIVDYGFREEAFHRIELHAGIDNAPSIRIAEKIGFRREGVLRERGFGSGGHYDMFVYGLLEGDPRAAPLGDR